MRLDVFERHGRNILADQCIPTYLGIHHGIIADAT